MWLRSRLADQFVIRASKHPVDQIEAASQQFVDGPHGRIECYAARKAAGELAPRALEGDEEPADLLFLKLPGTAGRAERSSCFPAMLFPDLSVEVWTWNPPGYGQSEGTASLRNIPPAVLAVWDHLLANRRSTEDGKPTRTIAMGNSLGSVTALFLGSSRNVDGVVVKNPPPLPQMIRAGDAWWNGFQGGRWVATAIEEQMDAVTIAGRCKVPAFFIQCERDRLVTPKLQQLIIDAYQGPKTLHIIKNAEHHAPYLEDDFPMVREGLQWLLDQPAPSKTQSPRPAR